VAVARISGYGSRKPRSFMTSTGYEPKYAEAPYSSAVRPSS
jgi:hypothetical protein